MVLSKLSELFNQTITINDFKQEIALEVSEYKNNLNKKGASNPVYLNEDIQNMVIRAKDVELLCNAFLVSLLDKYELNYVAEGVMLSNKITFKDDKIKDAFGMLADPEYFELVNFAYVESVLKELSV